MKKKVFIISLILIVIIGIIIYLNTYYHSDDVSDYIKSSESVEVKKINDGYFFDGPGKESAIIFYPGAKVEYTSYAPIMNNIASNGIDTYLIDMPFNIAFFGTNKADNIINNYDYYNWYIMGHSLGGVVASNYVIKHNNIKGLILLASYPTKKIPNDVRLLTIYGTNDGVLNMEKYNNSTKYFPTSCKKVEIKGGNHANFGNYGSQKKDNKSTISREEQQDITVNEIISFIK